MWIMGVSMVISFQSMRRRQMSSITIFAKIIRRTLILFALGLFVSNCKLMMPLNAHATLLASYLSFIFWFFFPYHSPLNCEVKRCFFLLTFLPFCFSLFPSI